MLKTIPPILGPDLLWTIAAMGHGDRLVIADRNYPARSGTAKTIEVAGVHTTELLEAIMRYFPIDDFKSPEAFAMVPDEPSDDVYEAHETASKIISEAENRQIEFAPLPRTEFYDVAKTSFATILTTDPRPFSCFILTKGVVR